MTSKPDNNIFIGTAIPYLTGDPHIGTAMDAVYADVLSRFHRSLGDNVVFTLGTDEYGDKNYRKALQSGMAIQDYFESEVLKFTDVYKDLQVQYSDFVRTSASPQHMTGVQAAWEKLTPYIYKGEYIGKYDVKEEQFIPIEEARTMQSEDPERYARLEDVKEENYFFKLSEFSDAIKQKIESNEMEIIPKRAKNEILGLINQGLKDISFTRPKPKVPWGIEVPRDTSQVMYVWLDALMNYLTALNYPEGRVADFWPADYQIMGKDIIRFHATIWPAILMALELPLPKKLYAHGHISLNGKPMSKSTGNVLEPKDVIDRFGSDVLRYYILRHVPSHDDGDFSWEKITGAYNGELANDLGNAVSRVAKMVQTYQSGVVGVIPEAEHDVEEFERLIHGMHFDKALDFIFEMIRGVNQYIEMEKPWEIAKSGDTVHLQKVLAHVVGNLAQVGQLLWPFMPSTAEKIEAIFMDGKVNFDGKPLFPRVVLK